MSTFNILKDTLKQYPRGSLNLGYDGFSETSSTVSASTRELTLAAEHGQRTSFREQPNVQVDAEDEQDARLTDIPLHVYNVNRDVQLDTPDSVASSTTKLLFKSSGVPNNELRINASRLQDNYNDVQLDKYGASNLENSTRAKWLTSQNSARMQNPVGDFRRMSSKSESNTKPTSCWSSNLVRILSGALVLLALVGGMVALVYFKRNSGDEGDSSELGGSRETTPPTYTEKPTALPAYHCPVVRVPLQHEIVVRCFDVPRIQHMSHIVVHPPPYINEGQDYNVTRDGQADADWTMEVREDVDAFVLKGPISTCSSPGIYKMDLISKWNSSLAIRIVNVTVTSELRKVNITLNQTESGNSTKYALGCSTNSGCEQSFVEFFAEVDKEEQYLRGVDFSCTIDYNDISGYSVSCVGIIPNFLLSQFEKITCRPRSSLIDSSNKTQIKTISSEIALPKCDLSQHCGYQCTANTNDYYAVDPGRCDIFHRCAERRIYTQFCAPGTFFDPNQCTCRHTDELPWCRSDGYLHPEFDVSSKICET